MVETATLLLLDNNGASSAANWQFNRNINHRAFASVDPPGSEGGQGAKAGRNREKIPRLL